MEILAVAALILAIVGGVLALLLPSQLQFAILSVAVGLALLASEVVFG